MVPSMQSLKSLLHNYSIQRSQYLLSYSEENSPKQIQH